MERKRVEKEKEKKVSSTGVEKNPKNIHTSNRTIVFKTEYTAIIQKHTSKYYKNC